jgi:hypothetical protein
MQGATTGALTASVTIGGVRQRRDTPESSEVHWKAIVCVAIEVYYLTKSSRFVFSVMLRDRISVTNRPILGRAPGGAAQKLLCDVSKGHDGGFHTTSSTTFITGDLFTGKPPPT